MKGGDYLIQVHIMEAKDLVPPSGLGQALLSNKEGTADPLVEVKMLGKSKTTKYVSKSIQPIFNETLHFQFRGLTSSQLSTAEISFNVIDHNSWKRDTKIGSFEIDIANIHHRPDHEAYRKWAPLRDLNGESSDIRVIYIYIYIYI